MGIGCECCSRKGELNYNELQNSNEKKIKNEIINKKETIQNNNFYTNINLNYISSQQKNEISDFLKKNYSVAYYNNKNYFDLISSSQTLNIKEVNKTFSEIKNINFNNLNCQKKNKSFLLESLRNLMLNEINNSRKNPLNIISKIEKYYDMINISKKNEYYIKIDKKNKIKLYKGKKSFDQCKNYLKNLNSLPNFILKNEMTFPFPEKNNITIEECTNEFYLNKTLKIINEELEKNFKITIINFHYDIMNNNTELSVILQIVDDTNSMFHRRNNIFNKEAKYIGINVGKISENLFCYYLLFGKDST